MRPSSSFGPCPAPRKRIGIDRRLGGIATTSRLMPGRLIARRNSGSRLVGEPSGQLNWTIRSMRSGVAAAAARPM